MATSGNDIITGTADGEHLNGGSGNDTLYGLGGNDFLNGGSGSDVLDGGTGADRVDGDSGNDLLIYKASENVGATDIYDGGSGTDTVRLVLTQAEWMRADVQADIARYLQFIAQNTLPNGQANNTEFRFTAFDLRVSKIEKLEITVDGVVVNPGDHAVLLQNDAVTTSEDAASAPFNLLANDSVPDGVQSVVLASQPTKGTVALTVNLTDPADPQASFTYTPGAALQALALGETTTDTFTYTVTDTEGDQQTATVTVTVTGTNDAPVVSAQVSGVGHGGSGAFSVDLLAHASDVDHGAVLHIENLAWDEGPGGVPDGFTVAGNTIAVDTNSLVYNGMAEGETVTTHFTYDVVDQHGARVQQHATVTITGTNDAPVVSAQVSGAGNEGSGIFSVDLLQNASDVDNGAVLHVENLVWDEGSGNMPAGFTSVGNSISVDTDALTQPAAGETVTAHFTYEVVDEHGARVQQHATVTITGTNDAPSVSAQVSGAGNEGSGTFSVDLLQNASDVDHGAVLLVENLVWDEGAPGNMPAGFTVAGNAIAVDTNSATYNGLAAGETASSHFTYEVVDQHGARVQQHATVTITGTNDVPSVSAQVSGAGNEGSGTFSVDLLQNASDVDHGAVLHIENLVWDEGSGNMPAGITVTGNAIAVDANSATFNALAAGETASSHFTYEVVDEHGARVQQHATVTITGTNDAPTVTGAVTGSVTEDTPRFLQARGQLTASDPDGGPLSWSIVGGTTTPQTQDFRFQVDNLKIIKAGNLFFEDTFGDGNPPPSSPFTFPTGPATYTTNGTFTEAAGRAFFDGTRTAVFGTNAYGERAVLNTDTSAVGTPGTGNSGLKRNANFSTEARFDLITPEDGGDAYGVRLVDQPAPPGNQNSSVDLVVLRDATGVHVALRQINLGTGAVTVLEQQNLPAGTFDQIVFRLDYLASSYVNSTAGGRISASFDLLTGGVVTASSSFAAQGAIFQGEDFTRVQLIGQSNQNETGVYMLAGTYGTLTLAQNGQWHYLLADHQANVQALGGGQTVTDTFTVRADDGHGGLTDRQIVVTVNGTAELAAVSDSLTIGENDIAIVNVLANDTGAGLTLTSIGPATVNNSFGIPLGLPSLSIVGNQLGVLTGTTFDALGAGQSATVTVPYTVMDAGGATATTQATITINGVNDAPVVQPQGSVNPSLTEDAAATLSASGFIDFSDVDLQDTHTVSASLSTTSGRLSDALLSVLPNALTATLVDSATGDGHGQYRWDFSLDNSLVQYLAAGEILVLNYRTTVTDTAPFAGTQIPVAQDIMVTIMGVNDAPIAQPDSGQVLETGTLFSTNYVMPGSPDASGNVLLNASDPDLDFIAVSGLAAGTTNTPLTGNIGFAVAGTYGALTISPSGIWGYHLDNDKPATDALAQGQHVTDVFTYTVTDFHGGSINETITIDVTGTNDAPALSSPLRLEVLEGSGSHQLDLLTGASDAEGDEIHVAVNNLGPYFSLDADGHTLIFDSNNPDFNLNPMGQFSDFGVSYDLVDSNGFLTNHIALFRVVGTDDAPTVFVQNGNAVIEAGGDDPGRADSQAFIFYSDPDIGAVVDPVTSGWTDNQDGTWSMVGVYGTATWSPTSPSGLGIVSYLLDNNDPDTIALDSTDNVYDTFSVTYASGTYSTSQNVSFEVVGRSDMYDRTVHWTTYFPTKEHSTGLLIDAIEWQALFPFYHGGISWDLHVGDQIELFGDFVDADTDLARYTVTTTYDIPYIPFDNAPLVFPIPTTVLPAAADDFLFNPPHFYQGALTSFQPQHLLFDVTGHVQIFEGELFNGYLLSGLPTIQSVQWSAPPGLTVEIGSDQQSLWVGFGEDEFGNVANYTFHRGDQVAYSITFAAGTPINAPAVNQPWVDVGATDQSIGPTVTIYQGFTFDLNVAYSGTVQFQGDDGTLRFQNTDFAGEIVNFLTNADRLDFSAITQGNAAIVGEISGTELAAHSIGWVTDGTDTFIYVNASDQSETIAAGPGSVDMSVHLRNVLHLHNNDFIL